MSRACVIGAGLGGLALAIRLQAAGVDTTLLEALDRPGGCARGWRQDGFSFDTGPATITDPAGLHELWQAAGRALADDVALLPVAPQARFSWPDGSHFDLGGDAALLRARIARLAPGDLAGYEEYAAYAARAAELADRLDLRGSDGLLRRSGIGPLLPALVRLQFWRPLHGLVAGFVRSDRLRQVLASAPLPAGGNPLTVGATWAARHKREQDDGAWYVAGGIGRLADAMAGLFEALGGTLRLSDAAVQVHAPGDRARAVSCASGWRKDFDAVASGGDPVHSYRDLLSDNPRGAAMARRLARKSWSPAVFVVHFTLDGAWPGIAHHTVLLGPRYAGLLADIYDYGVLPRDGLIWLSHPTVTDPSVAPPGRSLFRAAMPVANLGRLPIDWGEVGPRLARRILDEVGRRFIPDIHDRIIASVHTSPSDHARALNSWLGSGFGPEPTRLAGAWPRNPRRDAVIRNFYLAGAATHPGAGVSGVVRGARAAAQLMLRDLARDQGIVRG